MWLVLGSVQRCINDIPVLRSGLAMQSSLLCRAVWPLYANPPSVFRVLRLGVCLGPWRLPFSAVFLGTICCCSHFSLAPHILLCWVCVRTAAFHSGSLSQCRQTKLSLVSSLMMARVQLLVRCAVCLLQSPAFPSLS